MGHRGWFFYTVKIRKQKKTGTRPVVLLFTNYDKFMQCGITSISQSEIVAACA